MIVSAKDKIARRYSTRLIADASNGVPRGDAGCLIDTDNAITREGAARLVEGTVYQIACRDAVRRIAEARCAVLWNSRPGRKLFAAPFIAFLPSQPIQ